MLRLATVTDPGSMGGGETRTGVLYVPRYYLIESRRFTTVHNTSIYSYSM